MRVQLSEKSKAEFIELITKDSITCWFEGDEFVMPSGQGRTARGIVLGKLIAWQHQQSKVDELQKRVDAVKQLIQEYRDPSTEDKTFCHALSIVAYELEQAIKGGSDE